MNPWKNLNDLPREVWLLSIGTFINRLGTMALPFLTLYLTQGRGWTPQEAGIALAVFGAAAMLFSPLSGYVSDRMGHPRMLKASLWMTSLMLLILPFTHHRLSIFLVIFLWSIMAQAFWPSVMALLADLAPMEQRKTVFAFHRMATNLGMSVGPALGGFIAHWSYKWIFWGEGVATLVSAIFMTLFLAKGPKPSLHTRKSASAWQDRRLLTLLGSFLLALIVFMQIEGALPLWVVDHLKLGSPFFGLLFTVSTLLVVFLEVPLNMAMMRWPHGRQMALGGLFITAGFGLTSLFSGHAGLIFLTVLWTFGEMILFPTMSDAVASLAPAERRGEYMGLFTFTFATSIAVGPWLGNTAYGVWGPRSVWPLCAGVGLASAVLLGRFRLPKQD